MSSAKHTTTIMFVITAVLVPFASNAETIEQDRLTAPIAKSHPLLGRWLYAVPDRDCFEDVSFRSDGTRVVASGNENVRATYTITPSSDEKGFYGWTDTIVWTNQKPDCWGNLIPVGDVARGFTIFSDDKNRLYHCRQQDLKTCWGPYIKVPDSKAEVKP